MDEEHRPLTTDTPASDAGDGFDDVELGSDGSQRLGGGRDVRANVGSTPRGTEMRQQAGSSGTTGGTARLPPGNYSISTSPQFIDFQDFQGTQKQPEGSVKAPSKPPSHAGSRPGSFSLAAFSGRSVAAVVAEPAPPLSTPAGGLVAERGAGWAAAREVEADGGPLAGQGERRSALSLMTSPVQVPVCSVLFSVASGILALVFFILFLAHHDQWEETGCILLLGAASAAAGPASLTLQAVRDPTTLVCLGKQRHGPMVTEDSLAALLGAHAHAFADARAQLSFTPAGSGARWGISLEVKALEYNATTGRAVIQVEDWEEASAADSGTIYPGTAAFEEQFGSGAPLAHPLLVFRLEDDGLVPELDHD